MNQLWLQVFAVMIAGSIIKDFFYSPLLWAGVDIAVLVVAYLILRRYAYYVDLRKSMIFLGVLTSINIVVDFGIISGKLANILILILLAYWVFRGRYN